MICSKCLHFNVGTFGDKPCPAGGEHEWMAQQHKPYRADRRDGCVYGLQKRDESRWAFEFTDVAAMKVRGLVIWADQVKAKVLYIRNGPQVLHLNVDARFFSLFLSFEELSALAARGKFPEGLISFNVITSHMVFEVQLETDPFEVTDIDGQPLVTMAIWGDCITL